MSRYSKRLRAWCGDEIYEEDLHPSPQITVDDHVSINTGLVWDDGSTIWRDPNPIGFGRDDEW